MLSKNVVPLTKLKTGQSGVVAGLDAGGGAAHRLEAMGVRLGKTVKKVSGMFFRGPVTIQVGHTQVSIGHGMAEKVLIEVS